MASQHATFRMRPPSPLDLALTARVLRRSPKNPVDHVSDDGEWSRVLEVRGRPQLVWARQRGAEVVGGGPRERVAHTLGLTVDVREFFVRLLREPGLGELARLCAGLRPQRFPTVFEAIANAFACQQVSLSAGLTIYGRLAERFGPRLGDRVGAPAAARIAAAHPAELRACGLSARKAEWLRALASVPLEELEAAENEEAREWLLALRGIGPWTADYVLLRGLGRLDVFPRGDVGAAAALSRWLGRTLDPDEAVQFAQRFAPLQGQLYFCMLGGVLARDPSGIGH